MTWAKRLKRVFDIDIETCSECGGDVRIIASIEDPAVIKKILVHLDNTASFAATALLPDCRASPCLPVGLFDWRSKFNHDSCAHFGNGMADIIPGSGIGKKHGCIRSKFRHEHIKLTSLPGVSVEFSVWGVVWYFNSYVNIAFIFLILLCRDNLCVCAFACWIPPHLHLNMLHLIAAIQLYRIGFQIPAWVKFQCKGGSICHANAQPAPPTDRSQPWRKTDRIRVWCQLSY